MVESDRLKHLSDLVRSGFDGVRGRSAVVAVSGGADSAVLAWAACREAASVRAIHIHHGWPGSDQLATAARAICAALSIELTTVEVEVGSGASPEAQARNARYDAFASDRLPDEVLLTGHSADDQAETVLGNMFRGSGIRGIGGIPADRGEIRRPLLHVRRADLRELAALCDLPFVDDPTNLDVDLRRNFIRHEMLRPIEERFHPRAVDALARLAGSARSDDDHLELDARRRAPDPSVRAVLDGLPPPLRARAIRRLLGEAGVPFGGTHTDVESVEQTLRSGKPSQVSGGYTVSAGPVHLSVARAAQAEPGVGAVTTDLVGVVTWSDWRFEGTVASSIDAFPLSRWHAVFDADAIDMWQIRTVRTTDRIAFPGGTKDVTAAMMEVGIDAPTRRSWPVVVGSGDVVWIPGVRRAPIGWVTAETRRYLWVSAVREGR